MFEFIWCGLTWTIIPMMYYKKYMTNFWWQNKFRQEKYTIRDKIKILSQNLVQIYVFLIELPRPKASLLFFEVLHFF